MGQSSLTILSSSSTRTILVVSLVSNMSPAPLSASAISLKHSQLWKEGIVCTTAREGSFSQYLDESI